MTDGINQLTAQEDSMHIAAVEISESIQGGIDDLVELLETVGFLIILLIGYLVAKALAKVAKLALEKVGADRAVRSTARGVPGPRRRIYRRPS